MLVPATQRVPLVWAVSVPPVHGVPLTGPHHLGVAGEPFSPHPRRPREFCPSQRLPLPPDLELAGVLPSPQDVLAEIADCRKAPCTPLRQHPAVAWTKKGSSPATARFLLHLRAPSAPPPLPHRSSHIPVSAIMADDASRLVVLTCLSLISTSPIPSQNLG
jgi:hypothetical protein